MILLVTYALVIFAMQAFAGIGTKGNGLGNVTNAGRRAVDPGPRGLRRGRLR